MTPSFDASRSRFLLDGLRRSFTGNGKFYTTHIEDPALSGSNLPDTSSVPSFQATGYTTTRAIHTPGPVATEGVLVEWTDTQPSNSTLEGTARELLRVQLNTRSHPLGDLIFNPAARRGDPDWRVLFLECGNGASGESANVEIRSNPQRLDNPVGKILRIIPDLNEHVATSTVSENGGTGFPMTTRSCRRPARGRKSGPIRDRGERLDRRLLL